LPEASYTTTAKLPVESIWEFVREMDHWAPFLRGYQGHEKESEDDSVWTLKGDVGVLSRTLRFRVHVTEWAGPERVRFLLHGLNEQMEGDGEFRMERYEEEGGAPAAGPPPGPRRGPVLRLLESIVRFFLRLFGGRPERAASADAGPGEGMSRLTFRLRVTPGGPMAPMIEAMMRPLMQPTAEDLANRILGELEARASARG
jgi:carbon monoxide dehydrogenase subunit G